MMYNEHSGISLSSRKAVEAMLMTLICIPFVLLFGCYFLFTLLEIFGPAVLAMALLLKWTFSAVCALILYPFQLKETSSPA